MIDLMQEYWPEFIGLMIAHMIAVASPGPDFTVVTKHTISYGKRIGQITAIGIGLAILLHITYALLGFSLIVDPESSIYNPIIYNIVKYVGVAFLFYLGFQAIRAKASDSTIENEKQQKISPKKAFLIGFMTNALNVKALLFFLFLFTSLVKPTTPLSVKLFYGAWLSIYTGLWFYGLASFFGLPKVRQFFTRFGLWFDRAMGVILILLAVWLVFK